MMFQNTGKEMITIIYRYSLTDRGLSKKADGRKIQPVDLCIVTEPDGIDYSKLLDHPYIDKDSVKVWSEKDLTRREVMVGFRKTLTSYYIKKKKELLEYSKTYLKSLSAVPFNMDLPFKAISVEKYISGGVAQYLAMLNRELTKWYERNKRNLFKKEGDWS